jgi:hypothetical protein
MVMVEDVVVGAAAVDAAGKKVTVLVLVPVAVVVAGVDCRNYWGTQQEQQQ